MYIDGRADLYGDAFMDQFSADYGCRDDCAERSLNRWRIRALLLPPAAPLVAFLKLRPGWKEVFADRTAVIMSYSAKVEARNYIQPTELKARIRAGALQARPPRRLPETLRPDGGNDPKSGKSSTPSAQEIVAPSGPFAGYDSGRK